MTRASLLHILDHVGRISEAEVRELEQLATTFPYCQTAHVLLAKAAHDRGSMLASQRLRRAATYAADRQLLRQLLEQPAQEPTALLAGDIAQSLPETTGTRQAALPTGTATAFFQTLDPEDVQALEVADSSDESASPAPELSTPESAAEEDTTPEASLTASAESRQAPESEGTGIEHPEQDRDTAEAGPLLPTAAEAAETPTEGPLTESAEAPAPLTAAPETALPVAAVPAIAAPTDDSTITESASEINPPAAASTGPQSTAVPAEPEPEELLPATAPPIRPPAEAGISRFEFGLDASATPAASAPYQLPGVEEQEEEPHEIPVAREAFPSFLADSELAYALLGGGSRLGYALQMQDGELTSALPAGEFFAPDALLHAYGAAHRPKVAPSSSSLDLINRFLKNQPRLKSPAVRLSLAEEQTDLSVRSTSAAPQLASESLAKIMVRQGKIDKAIEIYERLMMRQPEKSAYFADQIQQLQTPE
ncbi:hypothetical protein [Hymenobacter psychrotolerans]|uniref:Uncharacterized protein n=1 Tax=Hymenobacter psychrotolerans DSM 18569 TaxID=1121959 RepID=A0A1M7F1Q9_9BACT|nr:hypothetical protein [Hymenobacter psychrotolerans]SHL97886.1 hypothetical protein SAMN02746009_03733 [Hymenobacter psychrotolerans DSM 18569]